MATPNLYEDNKGRVTKESGGSGGVKIYELEPVDRTHYLIKGATMDIGNLFILQLTGGDTGSEIIRALYIIDYVGIGNDLDFYRFNSNYPMFPEYLHVLEETPTGLSVNTGGQTG